MKFSLAEMTTWTPAEIEQTIRQELTSDVVFACGFDAGAGTWFIRFTDAAENVLHEEWSPERRLLYLNAFGWLMARKEPPRPRARSVWSPRRNDVPPIPPFQPRKGPSVPDPEDLDPEAIASVYARHTTSKK